MIDIKDLRERKEVYKANHKKKGHGTLKGRDNLIDEVLKIDEKWRSFRLKADKLRHERNKISSDINEAKKNKDETLAKNLIRKAKEIPRKMKKLEANEKKTLKDLNEELKKIPNLMHPKVPKGNTEKDNPVRSKHGAIKKFSFPLKNHVELAESLGIVDFESSAKVSGNGFYYLKGELALLNRALINFTNDFMHKQKYEYIEPPLMINRKIVGVNGDLEAFENALYKIQDEDLYLIPTAEHAILGMMSGKTVKEENLPLKFFGYSMCFRKEIGSHGINEKGLWRTHQFNKIEQFVFSKPDQSWEIYDELLKNTEEIMRKLGLPYRVVEISTGDLGDWKARSHDIEVWRPTLKAYGEVASLSNCTDYQARDLGIKGISRKGERYVLHTLNNTALATSRIMVAILENFQNKDGSVTIPKVLQKYMGRKKKIVGEKRK
jgi:seryl-tRNA synthetase